MAQIPSSVETFFEVEILKDAGFNQIHVGKVRHTFELPESDLLLVVVSDRLSIFDFVLNARVPDKGAILVANTVAWSVIGPLQYFDDDLVAYGSGIDQYLPEILRDKHDLQSRCLVIRKLDMMDKECIVRGNLTGSGWRDYQNTGNVCGHQLPRGLCDGSKLEPAIFTPSTKANEGHDVNITAKEVREEHGPGPEQLSLAVFEAARAYASTKGITIADTKFELGELDGKLTLGDERLTPDSSRFWITSAWMEAQNEQKSPTGFDKEPVRTWGKTVRTPFVDDDGQSIVGIHKLDPEDPEHVEFVSLLEVPAQVIADTADRYHSITEMLWDMGLAAIQEDVMGSVA